MRLATDDESKALVVASTPGEVGSAGVPVVDRTLRNSCGRVDSIIKAAGKSQVALIIEGNPIGGATQCKQSLEDVGRVVHSQLHGLHSGSLCLKKRLAIVVMEIEWCAGISFTYHWELSR